MNHKPLHLFEGYGVELEYMICSRDTLSVLPVTDQLIHAAAGSYESEIERGELCWSNELVLHVVELKTNGPVKTLNGLSSVFHHHIHEINALLKPLGGMLMPTSMHPWFDPETETKLWPHEYNAIYEAFNRVFDCKGHGWSNLQSAHVNLPFANDDEFGRLHTAIRLVLPLLPAFAASSPIAALQETGMLDNRMEYYRTNTKRIPSVTGKVIPEAVFTQQEYHDKILQPMYDDVAPYDPDGTLQDEWLNARGAIARFDRNTIEIRVLDIQECPKADIAYLWLIVEVLKGLVEERWCSYKEQQSWKITPLESILLQTIRNGEAAVITDTDYLELFGIDAHPPTSAGEVWKQLFKRVAAQSKDADKKYVQVLKRVFKHGPVARRLLERFNGNVTQATAKEIYAELCDSLHRGKLWIETTEGEEE